jgi:hypothetical protein
VPDKKNRMKNTIKGVALILLSTMLLFACNDDTTTPGNIAPSKLNYDPATLATEEGTSAESSVPTIEGTTPISYTLTTVPDAGSDITINANTGVITAKGTTAGIYSTIVTATNEAGSTEFEAPLSVEVKARAKITYKANIQGVIANNCTPCHVTGGGNTKYGNSFAAAKGGIDNIINRVNRMQGSAGFMPQSGIKLDSATLALIAQWKTDGLLEE